MIRNSPPEKRCPGCGCYKPVDKRLPGDVVCFDGPGAFDQGEDMSWLFPKIEQDWESGDDIKGNTNT